MKLIRRINAILTANFNDLIDRFEDPPTMLRQAIRDMEDTIQDALENAAEVVAGEKLLARQITSHHSQAETAQKQAEAALAIGNDQEARAALVRKKDHLTLCGVLDDQRQETHETAELLKRQISAMQIRLGEARRRFNALAARQNAAQARSKLATQFSGRSDCTEAFSLFERMTSRIEAAEARADALSEIAGFQSESVSSVATDTDIDAELASLRNSVSDATTS